MEVVQEKYYDFLKFWDWAISVSDPRVKDWFLMESPIPTLAITAFYVFIVNLGMRAMERFDPFKFKYVLFVYNMGLVALNFYISSTLLYYSTKAGYSYQCQSVKYTYEENEYNIAKSLYWFYISKFYEMLDTIFFVLRKKNNQVSFLHVYHHASMFPLWWIGIKWVAGGQSFFGAMVNSFIHVIMYTYYGISALGPEYQKYLWWKRYLTILQLTQFFIGMVYGMQSLYLRCDFPLWMQYTGLAYGVSIITLFLNFYIQAYIKKKPTPIAETQFCIGILHAVQSVFFKCDFPEWMHWALIFYAFTILMLFLNFYFHAYMKSMRNKAKQKKDKQIANGNLANGDHKSVSHANGHTETRKRK